MINITRLTETVKEAVSDYQDNIESQTPPEWLQGYLGKKMPDKTVDAIHSISKGILDTLDIMDEKKAAMNAALEQGKSAENWLTSDVMASNEGNGSTARAAVQFFNGIVKAKGEEEKVIDVEVLDENGEFVDDNWNDFKLKDSVKEVAIEAGQAGLKVFASEVFLKASDEGMLSVFTDTTFIKDTLIKGTQKGLKTAVSAGLTVAEYLGIIPPTACEVLAATAHKAVESMSVLHEVAHKKLSITDALVKIKNNTIATFSGMWQQNKGKIKSEIVEKVGQVFGPQGAVISGAINGLFAPKGEESRIKTVITNVAKSAVNYLTKKIELPVFSKIKNKLLSKA